MIPAACQGAGERLERKILPRLITLAGDQDPSVRLGVVEALGCIYAHTHQEAVLSMVNGSFDAFLDDYDNQLVFLRSLQVFCAAVAVPSCLPECRDEYIMGWLLRLSALIASSVSCCSQSGEELLKKDYTKKFNEASETDRRAWLESGRTPAEVVEEVLIKRAVDRIAGLEPEFLSKIALYILQCYRNFNNGLLGEDTRVSLISGLQLLLDSDSLDDTHTDMAKATVQVLTSGRGQSMILDKSVSQPYSNSTTATAASAMAVGAPSDKRDDEPVRRNSGGAGVWAQLKMRSKKMRGGQW